MFKIIFSFLLVVLVEGGFFDLTDVEDPLALLWNIPHIQHQKKLSECKIDNIRSGICMERAKCLFTGGTANGQCGIMFTCCSYEQSCHKFSDQKKSYFEITNLNAGVTSCKYTIKLKNKNVCQVRLDFEELTLAPATKTISATDGGHEIFSCSNDELRITPNPYGVPVLCGNNTNQHLYIHVNQTTDTDKAVNIDINLASRLNQNNKYLPKPTWKIIFTQLECPVKKNRFDIFRYKDFDDIVNDFNILAPQGAIQYFTESQGEIRSFGFNTTTLNDITQIGDKTSYPYLEHYTIAFRRPSNVCGIKFTTVKLKLFSLDTSACYHYMFIPEMYKTQNNFLEGISGICSASESEEFLSFPPGPLYVNFNAMKTNVDPMGSDTDLSHQGFQLNYELLSNYCPSVG